MDSTSQILPALGVRANRLLTSLTDLFFAPCCLACDGVILPGDRKRLICSRCRSRLRAPPPPHCDRCGAPRLRTGREVESRCTECVHWLPALRCARAAVLMMPPADRIVHQLKYRGWRALAGVMAGFMTRVTFPDDVVREIQIVSPVPTTQERLRERGYNQAELIARAFAKQSGLSCQTLLTRVRSKRTQTTLQPVARRTNVASAFRLAEVGPQLSNAHVLLVDDVLTTGATVQECTAVLTAGGARCVSVLTFARAVGALRLQ